MFDFSFGKLIIIFALCLVVLGPEKLPKLAQQLGRFAGQARAMARHFRAQLEQEIAAEELKKTKSDLEAAVKSSFDAVSSPVATLKQSVNEAAHSIEPIIDSSFDFPSANDSGHADLGATESTPTSAKSASESVADGTADGSPAVANATSANELAKLPSSTFQR